MKKYIIPVISIIALTVPFLVRADIPTVPTGEAVTLTEIEDTIRRIATFFIRMSGILAAISIISIGIWMMFAKDEASYTKAKAWFVRALWGALVIFGVGVILATVRGVWTGKFF